MGSCISTVDTTGSAGTAVRTIQNGSDEASLIYNGNLKMCSKVIVEYVVDVYCSSRLNARICQKPIFQARVIHLWLRTCKIVIRIGMKLAELKLLPIHNRNL